MKDGELDYRGKSGKLDYLDKRRLLDSMDDIASSGREISGKLDDICDEISDAYNELEEFFQYSHAEQMWMLEKHLKVLTGIEDALKNPRATQANELYFMAKKALKRDMIRESLKLLKQAIELNPLDYRVYMTMGYIYLMMDNLDKAANRFELAFRNVDDNKYKSFALLQMANVRYLMDDIGGAAELAEHATKIHPNDPKARYQYVVYESQNL
jgi:tetratricopeptide (TPR) repeat protein